MSQCVSHFRIERFKRILGFLADVQAEPLLWIRRQRVNLCEACLHFSGKITRKLMLHVSLVCWLCQGKRTFQIFRVFCQAQLCPVSLERTPEFPCLPLVLCMFPSTEQRKVCGWVRAGELSLRKLCPADASKWPSWPDSSPLAVVTVSGALTKCCCRCRVPHWAQTEPLPARARARACGPRSALDGVKALTGRDEGWIAQAVMRVGCRPPKVPRVPSNLYWKHLRLSFFLLKCVIANEVKVIKCISLLR